MPELGVREADQLLVAEPNDGVRRVELDDPHRTQARNFRAQELVEKLAVVGVGAPPSRPARTPAPSARQRGLTEGFPLYCLCADTELKLLTSMATNVDNIRRLAATFGNDPV
jgi:hypothetical protein